MTIHISLPAHLKGKNMNENLTTEGYDVSYTEAENQKSPGRSYIKEQDDISDMERRFRLLENTLSGLEVTAETLIARLSPVSRAPLPMMAESEDGGTAGHDERSPMGRVIDKYSNRLVSITEDLEAAMRRLEI